MLSIGMVALSTLPALAWYNRVNNRWWGTRSLCIISLWQRLNLLRQVASCKVRSVGDSIVLKSEINMSGRRLTLHDVTGYQRSVIPVPIRELASTDCPHPVAICVVLARRWVAEGSSARPSTVPYSVATFVPGPAPSLVTPSVMCCDKNRHQCTLAPCFCQRKPTGGGKWRSRHRFCVIGVQPARRSRHQAMVMLIDLSFLSSFCRKGPAVIGPRMQLHFLNTYLAL